MTLIDNIHIWASYCYICILEISAHILIYNIGEVDAAYSKRRWDNEVEELKLERCRHIDKLLR